MLRGDAHPDRDGDGQRAQPEFRERPGRRDVHHSDVAACVPREGRGVPGPDLAPRHPGVGRESGTVRTRSRQAGARQRVVGAGHQVLGHRRARLRVQRLRNLAEGTGRIERGAPAAAPGPGEARGRGLGCVHQHAELRCGRILLWHKAQQAVAPRPAGAPLARHRRRAGGVHDRGAPGAGRRDSQGRSERELQLVSGGGESRSRYQRRLPRPFRRHGAVGDAARQERDLSEPRDQHERPSARPASPVARGGG